MAGRSARSLMVRLERTFSSATVCDRERCYHAEPELQTLMETSRDPDRLLWAWSGWRRAVGPPMREVYPQLIDVLNSGARQAGQSSTGTDDIHNNLPVTEHISYSTVLREKAGDIYPNGNAITIYGSH